ncbi:hypothetical protein CUMW_100900 [Citrus unshiu]|nr:hypothetical protein CUMW_100900 [Citrus unshiu]
MRILLYYQRKELTNESISLSLSLTRIPIFFSPFSNKRGPSLYVAVYRTHLLLSSFIPSVAGAFLKREKSIIYLGAGHVPVSP